jgi:hypothetical protein
MSPSLKFEIVARAFELMTGRLAPGKDYPSACGPINEAERNDTWIEWKDHHEKIIKAMLAAVEEQGWT